MKLTVLLAATAAACFAQTAPSAMPRLGSVDERFQSFNIEMVEVIGGRFWRPYREIGKLLDAPAAPGAPVGMDPNLYVQRPPIDLANARLRRLAAALGPAYVRVSGTWANTTFYGESAKTPAGFGGVLTPAQWKGVVDFSRAVDAKIVTSFATGAGVRDGGVWTSAQAKAFLDATKSFGGSIAAAEFMNEPTFAAMGGAPKGYDAAAYGRDVAVFTRFLRNASPETKILGPGSVGEGVSLGASALAAMMLKSEDLLAKGGVDFDAFSYHFYGAVSKRCGAMGADGQTTPAAALSLEWLSRTDRVEAFYAGLRDKFSPGKPLWLTETGDAACGGNPWGATFLDSFRYLHQLGSLARRGVQVVAHNTLAASDYGLIDEQTLAPRPNYWSALLWRKFMGTTVLDAGAAPSENVYLYAHCLRGSKGGVALLAINASQSAAALNVPAKSERYTLSAAKLDGPTVEMNGKELQLAGENIPAIKGAAEKAGAVKLAPDTITFLAIPGAKNPSCQ